MTNAMTINKDQLPTFMQDDMRAGLGTEALSSNAFSPPRIKLAQATSPELDAVEGLKPGMFYNTLTKEVYGDSVDIIPCWLTESYYLWSPRLGGDSKLLARSDDGVHWSPSQQSFNVKLDKKREATWNTGRTVMESGLAVWGSSDPDDTDSPPAATYALNVVAMVNGKVEEGPVAISFMRSAIKSAKNFAGSLRMSRVPSFGRVFKLTAAKIDGAKGPYFEPRFAAAGFVEDENVYAATKAVYEIAKERGVTMNVDNDEEHSGGRSEKADSSAAESSKGI
jgi:hypothetical protein